MLKCTKNGYFNMFDFSQCTNNNAQANFAHHSFRKLFLGTDSHGEEKIYTTFVSHKCL